MIPELLTHGLKAVFVGMAIGERTLETGDYYADPGNRFWSALHEAGFTRRRLKPEECYALLSLGYGITDLKRDAVGVDAKVVVNEDDLKNFQSKMELYQPAFIAFNSKNAAETFLGHKVDYGRQPETIGRSAIYVLPSTSGAAGAYWSIEPLQALACEIHSREARGEWKCRCTGRDCGKCIAGNCQDQDCTLHPLNKKIALAARVWSGLPHKKK